MPAGIAGIRGAQGCDLDDCIPIATMISLSTSSRRTAKIQPNFSSLKSLLKT